MSIRTYATPDGVFPFTDDMNEEWDKKDLLEATENLNRLIEELREKRNLFLSKSDWTQIADAPVDQAAWATYRQALRDITTHDNFPNLADEDWPAKPE